MKFKLTDFQHDYVTNRLAAERAQELFNDWAKRFSVCTHPVEKVILPISGYRLSQCEFQCECGAVLNLEITGVKPKSSANPDRSLQTETELGLVPSASGRLSKTVSS